MSPTPVPLRRIKAERLVLRPTRAADADRAVEIQADWEVTRMLRMASFPPDRQEIGRWFMDHPREWSTGEAYRFAVKLEARMIGLVDIDEIANRQGSLGYWFDRSAWGHSYAFEAAHAVTRFAFAEAGLRRLFSGHAHDNQASGRVLTKLGFVLLDIVPCFSRSRGENIMQHRYALTSARA
jgi:ribosomal-protein-alanine N-acetyltransferase